MEKHEKFILTELPKSSVVNSNKEDLDNGIEDFINNAVQEHIKKIAQPPKPFEVKNFGEEEQGGDEETQEDIIETLNEENGNVSIAQQSSAPLGSEPVVLTAFEENNSEEIKKTVDDSSEKHNISGQISDKEQLLSAASQSANVDIEAIRRQEYQRGFAEAQAKHAEEKELAARQEASDSELAVLLQDHLSKIVPSADFDEKVAKLSSEAISGIAKKLHLVLPVDFKEIICNGLIDKLNKIYKQGSITVKVHPERYEYCSQILQFDSIPAKFKGNFKIVQDDKLALDDCMVEWEDTILEYSKEQLSEEIDIIIERLTNAA